MSRAIGSKNKNHKPRIKLVCLNCSNDIILPPWKKGQKFCSKKCHYDYKLERQLISKKRKETFIKKYGGFYPEQVYGIEGAEEFSRVMSKAHKLTHKNRSTEQKAEINNKISKSLEGHIVTSETREKLRKANLNRPKELLDRIIRNSLKACCARPNKFETRALAYANLIYNNRVRYTGNGSLIINGKSADAELVGTKTIFLFHGYYWHLKRFGLEITEENKRVVEKVDSAPFLAAGYKVIFIWEDEIDKLMETIK